jgi:ferredoxin-fold anticodon binding domain-containing protein
MAEELVNIRIADKAEGSEDADSEAFVNITFRIASSQWNRENLQ